ncbi:hypothetical protein REPUB_Repub19eG0130800 [Reevesia pubescens]
MQRKFMGTSLGLWGVVSYTPLLVRRQFGSQQFISITRGLWDFEFDYKEAGYDHKVQRVFEGWKELYESRPGSFSDKVTKECTKWKERWVNDTMTIMTQEATQSVCFSPEVVISKVDIMRQELAAKEKTSEREKTTLTEDATFANYDTMKKEVELERMAKELGVVKRDLENSKSLIKDLEAKVRYKVKGIKTSRK